MTRETFAPFGHILGADDVAPDYKSAGSIGWRAPLVIAGMPELISIKTDWSGLIVSKLERHFNVTQAFFPLAGGPAAVLVAEPTSVTNPHDIPTADRVRAFLVIPGIAYVLHLGTWHSLDRYPLIHGCLSVAMLTEAETTRADPGPEGGNLTQEIDYSKEFNLRFEIVPAGDI